MAPRRPVRPAATRSRRAALALPSGRLLAGDSGEEEGSESAEEGASASEEEEEEEEEDDDDQPVRLPPATRLPAGQAPRLIMPAPQYGRLYDDREHAPPLDAALPGNCNCGRDPCVVDTGGLFWCASRCVRLLALGSVTAAFLTAPFSRGSSPWQGMAESTLAAGWTPTASRCAPTANRQQPPNSQRPPHAGLSARRLLLRATGSRPLAYPAEQRAEEAALPGLRLEAELHLPPPTSRLPGRDGAWDLAVRDGAVHGVQARQRLGWRGVGVVIR